MTQNKTRGGTTGLLKGLSESASRNVWWKLVKNAYLRRENRKKATNKHLEAHHVWAKIFSLTVCVRRVEMRRWDDERMESVQIHSVCEMRFSAGIRTAGVYLLYTEQSVLREEIESALHSATLNMYWEKGGGTQRCNMCRAGKEREGTDSHHPYSHLISSFLAGDRKEGERKKMKRRQEKSR